MDGTRGLDIDLVNPFGSLLGVPFPFGLRGRYKFDGGPFWKKFFPKKF